MSLSIAAKDYIANHFGSGTPKCFVSGGIAYKDPNSVMQTGSTQDVVATLKMNIGGNARGPGNEVYIDITDWTSISDPDVVAIGTMQSGASQYCVASSTECVPGTKRCKNGTTIEQCKADGSGWQDVQVCPSGFVCRDGVCVETAAIGETGPLQVTILEGKPCPAGSPSVALDTTEAFAYFKATPVLYVGVMDILVQSLSPECYTYFTWEMRMWDGPAGETCPAEDPEWKQISRFLGEISDKKVISVKMLGASENVMIGGSFEIPSHFRGTKTICLSLWGDYDKDTLLADLAAVGYAEEIPWSSIK